MTAPTGSAPTDLELGAIQTAPQESTSSKWNYAVPTAALVTWIGFYVAAAVNVDYAVHDYEYPKNPINPELVQMAKKALISLGSIGAATIPVSGAVTVVKATYNTCTNICGGIGTACQTGWDAIKNSCSPAHLLEPEGIIINTLAAPFWPAAALYAACRG